ncbi:MAG: lysophospholipid acyltransferase family protein [Acidimicrobiales bacterium]
MGKTSQSKSEGSERIAGSFSTGSGGLDASMRQLRRILNLKEQVLSAARRMPLSSQRFPWAAPKWPASVDRPAKESRTGLNFDTEWSRKYPARLARAVVLDSLVGPFVTALALPEVSGLDRLLDAPTPLIFAANHSSHLDTPLLLASLPAEIRHRCVVAAAADYFFDRRWKGALSSAVLCAIPLERERVSRRSAESAARLLEEGWNMIIFPEGTRSTDGWAQEFRGGAAYLSKRTGSPVVPVYLQGTRAVLAKDARRVSPGRTRVVFGPVLRCSETEDAKRFAHRIKDSIAELADEASSDWYSARQRAVRGETPSLNGPEASAWRRAWMLDRHRTSRRR